MTNKKNIWFELSELPRNLNKESTSLQTIKRKMRNTNRKKLILSVIVTSAILSLLIVLIGLGQSETIPVQTTLEQGNLQAIYFVRDTEFDETKVKPSSLYSNVLAIKDPYLLSHFDKYLNLMEPIRIEDPSTYIHDPIIIELLFMYDNGKVGHYKMFDEETFYNITTKQWYTINSSLADNETRYIFMSSFVYSLSEIHSFLLLALIIGMAIINPIIKRMYLIRKIVYFEKSNVAKYTYYCLIIFLIMFTLLIVIYKLVIHIVWILLVFILVGIFIIYLEKKCGDRNANFYSLLFSTIFLICILINILLMIK
ncbi:putative protein OS=Ureibacillus acetophenoni OX=614649 GN=SAMN05877842_103197 PE=4 SV=1 [Ureibacillus acetophenoni]